MEMCYVIEGYGNVLSDISQKVMEMCYVSYLRRLRKCVKWYILEGYGNVYCYISLKVMEMCWVDDLCLKVMGKPYSLCVHVLHQLIGHIIVYNLLSIYIIYNNESPGEMVQHTWCLGSFGGSNSEFYF